MPILAQPPRPLPRPSAPRRKTRRWTATDFTQVEWRRTCSDAIFFVRFDLLGVRLGKMPVALLRTVRGHRRLRILVERIANAHAIVTGQRGLALLHRLIAAAENAAAAVISFWIDFMVFPCLSVSDVRNLPPADLLEGWDAF
jgi:hypothetical protein